jgi:hypothetical protein
VFDGPGLFGVDVMLPTTSELLVDTKPAAFLAGLPRTEIPPACIPAVCARRSLYKSLDIFNDMRQR